MPGGRVQIGMQGRGYVLGTAHSPVAGGGQLG